MGRLANTHILITGGNSGIGPAAAQEFDRESARVAVKLDHVTRTYKRDEFEVRALDDVSLAIPTQKFVAIMGPSGSGKTTLLNLVAGIDHATSGSVVVGEEEITTMNERELAVQNESRGAGTRRRLNLPDTVTDTDMFNPKE